MAITCLLATACEDYLDINEDPNNLAEVPVENVLPGAQIATGFYVGNTVQIVSSLWVQHMAGTGTQTDPYDRYNVSPGDFNNEWNLAYATIIDDLEESIQNARADGNFVHAGMAQILQAYAWAVTTDIWGDIPYNQAINYNEFETPVYDPQEQIYAQLINELDEAIADLNRGNATLTTGNGDLIYQGNVVSWKRAANSLKLKLYLQSRHKNPNSAAQIAALIANDTLITTNADNFSIPFTKSAGSQNPIYQYSHLTRPNDLILSQRFLDSLQATNDPRLPLIATTTGGSFVALNNGVNVTTPFTAASRSRWGPFVVGNGNLLANGRIDGAGEAPIRLITASMVHFWLAEAALTLGTPGDAAELYRQALQLNMDNMRTFVTTAPANFADQASAYIDTRVARFSAASGQAQLQTMIRDKWVASAGNAYEAYNDYRRTGFPNLELAQNAQPGVTRIPTRWPYVLSEIQSNSANVPIQDYPSGLLVPVWWMPQ